MQQRHHLSEHHLCLQVVGLSPNHLDDVSVMWDCVSHMNAVSTTPTSSAAMAVA